MEPTQRTRIFLLAVIAILGVITLILLSVLLSKTDQCENWEESEETTTRNLPFSSDDETIESFRNSTISPNTTKMAPWRNIRLPGWIFPHHYDLHLFPNLKEGTFRGQVNISLQVVESTNYVILHASSLDVSHVQVMSEEDGSQVPVVKDFLFEENQVVVIETSLKMTPGKYVLKLTFNGSLLGPLVGFYRSSYVEQSSGAIRFLASSKFEPTYARLAFPCFDEPNLKATFTVTITHEKEYFALSNMDKMSSVPSSEDLNLITTSFHKSKKMSTYLVAFVISDFGSLENTTSSRISIRVFARNDELSNAKYALEVAIKVKEFYEKYFDIPYPLPKQDLVAIPNFVSLAMENWGLITFRESSLFFNDKIQSIDYKKSVALTIAHELTHQWFGNLVTMNWWDDLWLNEGFAKFFAYEGIAQLDENEWKNWRQKANFITHTLHPALDLDSGIKSHPIIQPVNHPDEITSIFDTISYLKGSSIIRMLEEFMGQENFQKGIQQYLKNHIYGNARTEDLWIELSKFSNGINISKVMNTWTHQMGYPVLNVRHDRTRFIVDQNRFLLSNEKYNTSESPFEYLWEVPVTYRIGDGDVKLQWMHRNVEISWHDDELTKNTWYKFNVNQVGIYRVNYDKENWKKLIEEFCENSNNSKLSAADLINLLDDSFSLAHAGHCPYDIPLQLVRCLPKYEHEQMWSVAMRYLGFINKLLKSTEHYPLFRKFFISTLEPVYQKINWNDENSFHKKVNVLATMCSLDHDHCLQEAGQRLLAWIKNHTAIHPKLRYIVFTSGIKSGVLSNEDIESLWSIFLTETQPQLKADVKSSLASTRIIWRLTQLLELIWNDTVIMTQDALSTIAQVSYNPSGVHLAWNFFRSNWEKLVEKFTINSRSLGNLILSLTWSFSSSLSISEMESFYKQYPEAGAGSRPRQQALENVKSNQAWLAKRAEGVKNWLLASV